MSATGKMSVRAISGPTHVQQVPFAWDPVFSHITRVGVPDVFDFDWITVVPAAEE